MARLFQVKNPAPSGAGIRVFIAMPTGSGFLQCPAMQSLMQTQIVLSREGIAYEIMMEAGNCHVDDTRNSAVREFMKSDCTDLFFIDADVSFDPESVVKLLRYDRDLVAGVYPKKQDDEDFPVSVAAGVELQADADGLVEVEGAPTGFMRIRRNVLEAMCEANKHRRYKGQGDGPDDPPYTILFERIYEAGRRFSGDYAFCRKWRQMGGKVFVDPELPFTHEGLKEWAGVLGDFWRKKHGVTQDRYEEAIKRLRAGDDTPELFAWLYQGWDNPWSAPPSMLATVYHMAKKATGPILECGSGLTTLVIAMATEASGQKVLSLESDSAWASRITQELSRLGLNAEVCCSPITEYAEKGSKEVAFRWYDAPTIDHVSLVVCDGPVRKYGRSGLFKLLSDEIANADIVMDDTEDSTIKALLAEWAECKGKEIHDCGRFSVCRSKRNQQ